jgi:hypothetical protein
MGVLNPWLWVGVLVALFAAGGTGFYYGSDYQKGKSAREEVLIKRAGDAAAEAAASKIAGIEFNVAPIRERITHEVQTNTVYKDCLNTDDAMKAINEARTGKAVP